MFNLEHKEIIGGRVVGRFPEIKKEMSELNPLDWNSDELHLPVKICLLGHFRLLVNGKSVPVQFGGKTETFLAILALKPQEWIPREQLVQLIWPTSDLVHGLISLRTLTYNLHKLLGPALKNQNPVLQENGSYRLNTAAGIGVDISYFDQLVAKGEQQLHLENQSAAYALFGQAVNLYSDDLYMASDVQSIIEQERLRTRFLALLTQLAYYFFQMGDYTACMQYLWRLLEREACREDAHRMIMRCYVRRGERAAALHQYKVCQNLLMAEFNVIPEPATITLYNQILNDPDSV